MLHPDELRGRTLRYLLDLDWGGDVHHLSDGAHSAVFDGVAYTYTPGLDYDANMSDAADLFRRTPEERKAAIVVHLAGLVDVPARVAAGYDLRSATARLYVWIEGTNTRELLLDGEVREPAYGMPANPHAVEFMLVERPQDDRSKLPTSPLAKILRAVTHTAPDDKSRDEWYPTVIGKPGASASPDFVWATPAQLVDASSTHVLVSDGRTAGGTVRLKNFSGTPDAENYTVAHQADALGRIYAYVDYSSPALTIAAGDDLWVAWNASSGGILGRDGNALEGAGDIIEHFLGLSSLRWDAGRIAAVAPRLNAYTLAGYIQPGPDERISAWEFLRGDVLPLLPVGIRNGPDGLYLVIFDPDASDPLEHLEAGRNCSRTSAIVYDDEERYSEVRFSYEFRGDEDKPNAVAVVTGSEATIADDPTALRDPFLAAGLRLYGERVLEAKSAWVYDDATAVRIASWMARRHALPSRLVEYDVDHALAFLEPGDVVELTDAGVSLSCVFAMVDEREIRTDGTVLLVLRLWPRAADLRS